MEPSLGLSHPLVAALATDATFLERSAYQLNGLIVVFTALGSIWGLLELIGWLFRRAEAMRGARAAKVVAAVQEEGVPAETVAVIAAAVAATVGSAHVIRAINPAELDPAWAREGRREVFQSHRIR